MKAFEKMPWKLNTIGLRAELLSAPHLWDQRPERRTGPNSPHREMVDIWVRYREMDQYKREHGSDLSKFCDEHESVWLPCSWSLPSALGLVDQVAGAAMAKKLGGVLITKLPPGGKIYPHVDSGWHAATYDKYYVAVRNPPGAVFGFDGGSFEAEDGDVFWFRNDVLHWVENNGDTDRIAMIVCIKS